MSGTDFFVSVRTLLSVSGRILCRLSTNPVHALLVMLLYSDFMSASLSQASIWSVEMAVNMYGKKMKFIPNLKGLALKE